MVMMILATMKMKALKRMNQTIAKVRYSKISLIIKIKCLLGKEILDILLFLWLVRSACWKRQSEHKTLIIIYTLFCTLENIASMDIYQIEEGVAKIIN